MKVPVAAVTDALLAALRAVDTNLHVGDHVAPPGAKAPYAILEHLGASEIGGDLGDPQHNATLRYRIRCVGQDPTGSNLARRQADRALDKLRTAMTGVGVVPAAATWNVGRVAVEAMNGPLAEGATVNVSDDWTVTVNAS